MPLRPGSRLVEAIGALVFFLVLAAAALLPLSHLGWESLDEVDFIHAGRALDRTLAREGPLAVWNEVLLEPGIGRIRPVTYLYLWLSLRFGDYVRPRALAVHAVPVVLLGLVAFLWCRRCGAQRGLALAAAAIPLLLAHQPGTWMLTIIAEPLLALLGLATLVALREGALAGGPRAAGAFYLAAVAIAGACLLTKEPGIAILPVLAVHALRGLRPDASGQRDRTAALVVGAGTVALLALYAGLWAANRGGHTYSASYVREPLAMVQNIARASLMCVQDLWLPTGMLVVWLAVAAGWGALSPEAGSERYWGALAALWGAGSVLVVGPWALYSTKNYYPAMVAFPVAGAILAGRGGLPATEWRRGAVALAAALLAYPILLAATGHASGRGLLAAAPAALALAVGGACFAASSGGRAGSTMRAGLALLVVPQLVWALALGERAVLASGFAIERRSAPLLAALDVVARDAARGAVLQICLPKGEADPLAVPATGFYGGFIADYLEVFHGREDLVLRFRPLSAWGRAPVGAVELSGAWPVSFSAVDHPPHLAPGHAAHRFLAPDRAENLVDPLYFAIQCKAALFRLVSGRAPEWPRLALVYDYGYREFDVAPGTRQVAK